MSKRAGLWVKANAAAIKAAKCQRGARTEYRIKSGDTENVQGERVPIFVPGLALFCEPSGAANWYAVYTVKGEARSITKRVKIGPREAMTWEDAAEIAKEHFNAAKEGSDLAQERKETTAALARQKQRDENAVKLQDLVKRRLDTLELSGELKARTVEQQRDLTRIFFAAVPNIATTAADKITASDMREALNAFVLAGKRRTEGVTAGQPYSLKTRDIVKMALSAAFKWGQDTGICENNPMTDIRNAAKVSARTNYASDEGIQKLWQACTDEGAPLEVDMRDVLRLALLTGQRRSEIANMRASQIDQQARTWTIPGDRTEYRKGKSVVVHGLTKNGQEQVVPLSDEALRIVQGAVSRAGARDKLFNVTPGAVTMAMRRIREKYQIEDVTVHALRRTISKWAGLQRDIRHEAIEALLNHQPRADDVTRRHYQQARLTDEVREVLERWARHVMGIVAGDQRNVVRIAARVKA